MCIICDIVIGICDSGCYFGWKGDYCENGILLIQILVELCIVVLQIIVEYICIYVCRI